MNTRTHTHTHERTHTNAHEHLHHSCCDGGGGCPPERTSEQRSEQKGANHHGDNYSTHPLTHSLTHPRHRTLPPPAQPASQPANSIGGAHHPRSVVSTRQAATCCDSTPLTHGTGPFDRLTAMGWAITLHHRPIEIYIYIYGRGCAALLKYKYINR